jgi:hypothetical protein
MISRGLLTNEDSAGNTGSGQPRGGPSPVQPGRTFADAAKSKTSGKGKGDAKKLDSPKKRAEPKEAKPGSSKDTAGSSKKTKPLVVDLTTTKKSKKKAKKRKAGSLINNEGESVERPEDSHPLGVANRSYPRWSPDSPGLALRNQPVGQGYPSQEEWARHPEIRAHYGAQRLLAWNSQLALAAARFLYNEARATAGLPYRPIVRASDVIEEGISDVRLVEIREWLAIHWDSQTHATRYRRYLRAFVPAMRDNGGTFWSSEWLETALQAVGPSRYLTQVRDMSQVSKETRVLIAEVSIRRAHERANRPSPGPGASIAVLSYEGIVDDSQKGDEMETEDSSASKRTSPRKSPTKDKSKGSSESGGTGSEPANKKTKVAFNFDDSDEASGASSSDEARRGLDGLKVSDSTDEDESPQSAARKTPVRPSSKKEKGTQGASKRTRRARKDH